MPFVAIEFENNVNHTHNQGYLRIPYCFNTRWHLGFRKYLSEKYKITGELKIYPLRFRQNSRNMGLAISGYKNMEDDFNLALQSTEYYPICEETDNIRREWSQLDPRSPDYEAKGR